jgi:hypothetical protein
MGVEPTTVRSARPVTGVEDRGIHRDTTTPVSAMNISKAAFTGNQLSGYVKFKLALDYLQEEQSYGVIFPLL